MSKKLLKNLHQTHGAIITDEFTELDKLSQSKKGSRKISLAAKYEDKIGDMTLEELQDLAAEMGLVPVDNRNSLIRAIKKEFKKN